jgi:hypothetical protein
MSGKKEKARRKALGIDKNAQREAARIERKRLLDLYVERNKATGEQELSRSGRAAVAAASMLAVR